jgi:uncharacterized protein (UPF0147 family)
MKLADLSSKHKKLRSIHSVLDDSLVPSNVKASAEESLKIYQNALYRIWEKQEIDTNDVEALHSLERELDRVCESLRLFAKPHAR